MSLIGVALLLFIAWVLSSNRHAINWRTVGLAFVLQTAIAGIALFTDWGHAALLVLAESVTALLDYSRAGSEFVFGGLVSEPSNLGFIFAFNVLPVIICRGQHFCRSG